jgi:hypothetical protein
MCQHEPRVGAICEHLATAAEYCEWFSGRGLEHDLICPACAAAERHGTTPVCAACMAAARAGLAWNADRGVLGRPAVRERDGGLAFVHERVELAARLPAPILADRVGLDQSRAAQWVRAAGATYGDYVAVRHQR